MTWFPVRSDTLGTDFPLRSSPPNLSDYLLMVVLCGENDGGVLLWDRPSLVSIGCRTELGPFSCFCASNDARPPPIGDSCAHPRSATDINSDGCTCDVALILQYCRNTHCVSCMLYSSLACSTNWANYHNVRLTKRPGNNCNSVSTLL